MRPLFAKHGVHALVDGQYGSTGKGALAAWLAVKAVEDHVPFMASLYSGGPNSGHTFYDLDGGKHVLKQLPTFAVASHLLGHNVPIHLTAGAIIDPDVLFAEATRYAKLPIYVHPNAAVVYPVDKAAEHSGSVAEVAGTRSGAGAALARKVLRDPTCTWQWFVDRNRDKLPRNVKTSSVFVVPWSHHRIFMEVSQGFSLGLNQQFYPKCTSRECTVAQGISDASLPPKSVTMTYMSVRTYPIRVGNVDGHSSGDCYDDQMEIKWKDIGQQPELTTVTQRERRIFTWSWNQFDDARFANEPDWVFINFLNYCNKLDQQQILKDLKRAGSELGANFGVIGGYGPEIKDVVVHDEA